MNIIGIDLGNSNSYYAIQIGDRLEPLMDPNDQYGLPSVLFHRQDKSGRIIEFIGRDIRRRLHQRKLLLTDESVSPLIQRGMN